jgi:hypothetical protein
MARLADELLTYDPQYEPHTSKVRVSRLAARQCGRVTWAQLRALDIPKSTIDRWIEVGYLLRVLPRVYAVGHAASDERARLFSLVLFAGPSAALSHGTAAHWRGWLRYPVPATHLSTPRRIRSVLRGVRFHCGRELERESVNGLPCTTVTQTLLDLASTEPIKLVRRALAQLDYERSLKPERIRASCGRGRPGSAALITALDSYIPQLALTKSDLEDDFLVLCVKHQIPLPQVNVCVHGEEVDCYWPDIALVVELDGGGNHGTSPQRERDQRRDLKLRARGVDVIRYTLHQVTRHGAEVAADALSQIDRRRRHRGLS